MENKSEKIRNPDPRILLLTFLKTTIIKQGKETQLLPKG